MISVRRPPGRGRALLVLLVAAVAGVVLAGVRGQVGRTPGIAPDAATLVVAAQWAVWLLTSYAVAVAGCVAALTALGRPSRARALLWLLPAAGRPALAAALGVVLTASPAVASPSPSPAAPPSTTTADPFDWTAPTEAAAGIAARISPASPPAQQVARRAPPRQPTVGPAPRPIRRPLPRTVRVRPGDCLWSLAARDLAARRSGPRPADIAVAWHRWYADNRPVIGPDPGLLHPGEVLRVPLLNPPLHPSTRITRRPS